MAWWNIFRVPTWMMLLIGIVVLLYVYFNRKFQYWKKRGVKSLTFLDCLKQLRDLFRKPAHEVTWQHYKKFGRIYGTFLGFEPQLSLADPTLLKQILVKDFHMFQTRTKVKLGTPLLDDMLSLLNGEAWKRVRCIVSPSFTSSRIRKMAYLVRECSERFAKRCEKAAENNEEVDCKLYFTSFAVDIIGSAAFGTTINAIEQPDHPFMYNARVLNTRDSLPHYLTILFFPKALDYLNSDIFHGNTLKYFEKFAKHVISERDKKEIRENDYLQILINAQRGEMQLDQKEGKEDQYDHKSLSYDELIAQCIVFILAGGESTSTTLAFLSWYLALYPEVQERLAEEIDRIWEHYEEINFDVVQKMTYLDAVVCEALRIQPIAGQLMRVASEDYQLGDTGIKIEKGIPVIIPIYAMHHDPEFFPEPEKFVPERFLPENRHLIPPYSYLPFGEGPRNCVGMRFSTMALKLCTFILLRTIRLEATENTKKPVEFYKGHSLLQPKQLMVRMTKRK